MRAEGERYELVVARPAAREIAKVLPEPLAVAVTALTTDELLRSPQLVGQPLASRA